MPEEVQPPPVLRAAGILLTSGKGNILLTRRVDDGHYWSVPAGGIDESEDAESAARRELLEETGYDYQGPLNLLSRRVKDGVDFTTFGATIEDEFKPTLNREHDLARWVPAEQAIKEGGLHPGLVTTLSIPNMHEMDIAKAVRDKELASPVYFGNFMLVNMRITGTGASYRSALDEFVWRDPSIYMNEDFVQRCNGLPVIMDHPEGGNLDSKEYADRAVGTIVLPYLDEVAKEVWGIAKIYDEAAKRLIADGKLSTSPAVVFTKDQGHKQQLKDGEHILIEGEPALIDHLALCDLGVWDKGGPPKGVESNVIADSANQESAKQDYAKPSILPRIARECLIYDLNLRLNH